MSTTEIKIVPPRLPFAIGMIIQLFFFRIVNILYAVDIWKGKQFFSFIYRKTEQDSIHSIFVWLYFYIVAARQIICVIERYARRKYLIVS